MDSVFEIREYLDKSGTQVTSHEVLDITKQMKAFDAILEEKTQKKKESCKNSNEEGYNREMTINNDTDDDDEQFIRYLSLIPEENPDSYAALDDLFDKLIDLDETNTRDGSIAIDRAKPKVTKPKKIVPSSSWGKGFLLSDQNKTEDIAKKAGEVRRSPISGLIKECFVADDSLNSSTTAEISMNPLGSICGKVVEKFP